MVNNGPLYADLAKLLVKCDERKENLSLNLAAITHGIKRPMTAFYSLKNTIKCV
jgi:hypothetical protein